MALPLPLPDHAETTDEDTLSRLLVAEPELVALLRPDLAAVVRAVPGRPLGLGSRRVACTTSVAAAVTEDRR